MPTPPLTPEQQIFAAEHHGLIWSFMHKYSLDDDFYDLLAARYLHAVVRYTTEEQLQQYAFSTVAWYHMRSGLASYFRRQEKQIAAAQEYISEWVPPEEPPIDADLWQQIENALTWKQYEAVKLRDAGYSNAEIAKICGVKPKAIEKRFARIRQIIQKSIQIG